MTLPKRTKFLSAVVVITTFIMVFLPAQIAFPLVQYIIIGVTAGISLILQLLLLPSADTRGKRIQSLVLLGVNVLAVVLMFLVY